MSESAPRNPRLENFEANKAQHKAAVAEEERKAFEAALYDQAGETDFSDEARRRIEEADAYERQLEAMAQPDYAHTAWEGGRGSRLDKKGADLNDIPSEGYLAEVEDAYAEKAEREAAIDARNAEIEQTIQDSVQLRMANKLAAEVSALYNKPASETVDTDIARIKDLEDRITVLLEAYSETDGADPEMLDVIINRSHRAPEAKASSSRKESEATDAESDTATADEAKVTAETETTASDTETENTDKESEMTAAEIRRMLEENPELKDDPEVQKKIAEILGAIDTSNSLVDNLDEARAQADAEYEAREGKPYDVDEGRIVDVEQAHVAAHEEKEARELAAEREADRVQYDADQRDLADERDREADERDLEEDRKADKWWKNPIARLSAKLTVGSGSLRDRLERVDGRKSKVLFAAAGAAAVVGLVLWYKNGGSPFGGGSGTKEQAADAVTGNGGLGIDKKQPVSPTPEVAFSNEALNAHDGEGWLNQLKDMNIPASERPELLQKILESDDPGIKEWVYEMSDGNPGISHPGAIPESVLESIEELRNK